MKGLNFPIRQLDITIKHFPQNAENTAGNDEIFAAFMLFRTAHNMNEPLMYVWLCFNNLFLSFRGMMETFPFGIASTQCERN